MNNQKWILLYTLCIIMLIVGCFDANYLGYTDSEGEGGTGATDDGTDDSSDDSSSTDDGPDWNVCAEHDVSIGLLPLDMLLALDTSYSMDYAPEGELLTKWEAVKSAVKTFVKTSEFDGASLGIQYFPLRKICSVDAYATPAVPFTPVVDAVNEITNSLDAQRMADGTPMVPMLTGVMEYATTWAAANTDRRTVVVMATDGIPDSTCLSSDETTSNTLENVENIARTAADADNPVYTYVIGVGSELTALNAISQAGNGEDAVLIDLAKGNIEADLLLALENIRRRSVCEYLVADLADGSPVNPKEVNIKFSDYTVTDELFVHVGHESSCDLAPGKGWYYDDPLNPKLIVFCADTCERVQARVGNNVNFVLGCPTVVIN